MYSNYRRNVRKSYRSNGKMTLINSSLSPSSSSAASTCSTSSTFLPRLNFRMPEQASSSAAVDSGHESTSSSTFNENSKDHHQEQQEQQQKQQRNVTKHKNKHYHYNYNNYNRYDNSNYQCKYNNNTNINNSNNINSSSSISSSNNKKYNHSSTNSNINNSNNLYRNDTRLSNKYGTNYNNNNNSTFNSCRLQSNSNYYYYGKNKFHKTKFNTSNAMSKSAAVIDSKSLSKKSKAINNCNNNKKFISKTTTTTTTITTIATTAAISAATTSITTSDFSKLPNVILSKIFSYLNLHDRLNASQSCKSWRNGLFDPYLWHNFNLVIYLCNKKTDIESAYYKMHNFGRYAKSCSIKYNPNDIYLFVEVANLLEFLNRTLNDKNNDNNDKHQYSRSTFQNSLKYLSLEPIYSYNPDDETSSNINHQQFVDSSKTTISHINRRIFKTLNELVMNSKSIEHLALGCLTDLDRTDDNLDKLVFELNRTHSNKLKSLHISTIKYASSLSLASIISKSQSTIDNYNDIIVVDNINDTNDAISISSNNNIKLKSISNNLFMFHNLNSLSIDYEYLNDDLILQGSCFVKLQSLSINVNELNVVNLNNNNQQENLNNLATTHIRDETWQLARAKNSSLRVKVNFLMTDNTLANYKYILNSTMPLETLRMYFCKSLNPNMLQYLSDNYSDTLQSLCIVDSIQNEPNLRYHVSSSRNDTDPDPLILLCWKCRNLTELVLVGYEILEINLIAIAKLRSNLKLFYVPMDCIIDLTYGKFKNDDFIEDEDGEDTLIDYGSCSHQVIDKVCKILKSPNWHPLEKDELPMCVYDKNISLEEAFLDTLINDQNKI